MYVAENNSLKKNIEKLSKKTYVEAVVDHIVLYCIIEGKSALSAQDSDAETKSEAPRTSIISLNTITLSQGVKSRNQDEKNDNVTSKESSMETGSVPDARYSEVITPSYSFQKRKNWQKRLIIPSRNSTESPSSSSFVAPIQTGTRDTEEDLNTIAQEEIATPPAQKKISSSLAEGTATSLLWVTTSNNSSYKRQTLFRLDNFISGSRSTYMKK